MSSGNYIGREPNPVVFTPVVPRGYIDGLVMSTPGASPVLTIGAGEASDVTKSRMMTLAAALAKTTGAWAQGAGNGGLDTGAIAPSTWYHIHEILRPDTGAVDGLISLSPTAPVMPANFTFRRRIGSWKTTAGSLWEGVTQVGNYFSWNLVNTDDANPPGNTLANYVLPRVPTGVQVEAEWRMGTFSTGTNDTGQARVFPTFQNDDGVAPDITNGNADIGFVVNTGIGVSLLRIAANGRTVTDTLGRVAIKMNAAAGTTKFRVYGYWDFRGRDA